MTELKLPTGRRNYSVLQCPKCGNQNLHQDSYEVVVRTQEDEAGVHVNVQRTCSVHTSVMDVDDTEWLGRRDHLIVHFTCEHCGELEHELAIMQHKGETHIFWLEPSEFFWLEPSE